MLLLLLSAVLSLGGGVWLEQHLGDEVLVGPLWIFVDYAFVVVLGQGQWVVLLAHASVLGALVVGVRGDGSHMHNWEGLEEFLSRGFFEASLSPRGTFKEKTVNVDSLIWWAKSFLDSSIFSLDDFLHRLVPLSDGIERPLGLSVLSSDLLKNSGQESLLVIETSQPEAWWSSLVEPVAKLVVAVDQLFNPSSESWAQPRDLNSTSWIKDPVLWYSEIIDVGNSVYNFGSHDDLTIDSKHEITHSLSYNIEHHLELLNLLAKEDVEWNVLLGVKSFRTWKLGKLLLVLDLNEVLWKLLNKLVSDLVFDLLFLGFTTGATSLLWSSIDKSIDHGLGLVETEGKIGSWVETEDNWRVLLWEGVNILLIPLHLGNIWNLVDELRKSVKVIVWLIEDLRLEPKSSISIEHFTVHVVGNSSSVLDLTNHVSNSFPGDLRGTERSCVHVVLDIGK